MVGADDEVGDGEGRRVGVLVVAVTVGDDVPA